MLVVRRARPPAQNLYTMPGGVVEAGETLFEAVKREVREETALEIEPVALAGHREAIVRDATGRVERHFVILCFAARWISGEVVLNEELDDARWLPPAKSPPYAPPRAWPRSSPRPSKPPGRSGRLDDARLTARCATCRRIYPRPTLEQEPA